MVLVQAKNVPCERTELLDHHANEPAFAASIGPERIDAEGTPPELPGRASAQSRSCERRRLTLFKKPF